MLCVYIARWNAIYVTAIPIYDPLYIVVYSNKTHYIILYLIDLH
jgi:hypothetical protein